MVKRKEEGGRKSENLSTFAIKHTHTPSALIRKLAQSFLCLHYVVQEVEEDGGSETILEMGARRHHPWREGSMRIGA